MVLISPSFLALLILTIIMHNLVAEPTFPFPNAFCNGTKFSNNSQYQTNLNNLFRTLSSNATANSLGFYAASVGNDTSDAVHGLFLCRGDQNQTSCSDCVKTATTTDLPKTYCANRRVAVIWYDECMVRYSNETVSGRLVDQPYFLLYNTKEGSGNRFTNNVADTLNNLGDDAANDPSGRKFATKVVTFSSSAHAFYGLAQCIPDLTTSDCEECLKTAIGHLRVQQGSRVLTPSCNVRYEIYSFFNTGAAIDSPPTAAADGPNTVTNASPPTNPAGKKKTSPTILVVAVMVPIMVMALLIGLCTYRFRKAKKKYLSVDARYVLEDFTTAESLTFDFGTLDAATNHFSDDRKLGGGDFGNVYKGTLPNGQELAVKRLSRISDQGMESFKNEAVLIAKLQHKNLVKLLGFCLAGEEKLLVYEFVPNKSLNYLLFDPKKKDALDWPIRYNIITGIARGILYLHEDSRPRIIHRDLKAANILLEADMNPKISDFGLARMFKVEQTEDDTSIISGTYGYMAPEYAMHGQFSIKSDVYSFGVLLLEIVSGMKINSRSHTFGDGDLLTHAWRSWKEKTPLEFVDPMLRDSSSPEEILRCIGLGLSCVQESANDRPTMSTIVFMLNTNSSTSSIPPPRSPRSFYCSSTESSHATTTNNPLSITAPSSRD